MRRKMNDAHQPAPSWLFLLDAFARHAAALIRSLNPSFGVRKANLAIQWLYCGIQPQVRYTEPGNW